MALEAEAVDNVADGHRGNHLEEMAEEGGTDQAAGVEGGSSHVLGEEGTGSQKMMGPGGKLACV